MRGMIVAAGLGTRLLPLTHWCPKPAIPVRGVPLVAYGLAYLARHGVDEVMINTHHLPQVLERAARDWCPSGLRLRFSHEAELLDTGGGIGRVADFLRESDPAVVIGGDMLIDCELSPMLQSHRQTCAAATLLLKDDPRAAQFGTIGVDSEGRVRRIANRLSVPRQASGSGTELTAKGGDETSAGLYAWVNLISPRAFDWLPEESRFSHLDHWFLPALREDPSSIRGFLASEASCRWEPVGTPGEYWRANFDAFQPSYLDAEGEASKRGVTFLPGAVIGRGAQIDPAAELDGVVVWDGETVPAGTYRFGVFAGGEFHSLADAR